jgi:hypothetical protein
LQGLAKRTFEAQGCHGIANLNGGMEGYLRVKLVVEWICFFNAMIARRWGASDYPQYSTLCDPMRLRSLQLMYESFPC